MILRRIAENLAEQNWFVVVIEIMIVVVGIFIGLQVDDWNENRKDREEEKTYLVRIYQDQLASLSSAEERAVGFKSRAEHILELIDYLDESSAQRPEENVIQNSLCRWYAPASISIETKTFDELVSSGRLNLIQDPKLRELLQIAHNRHDQATTDFAILTKPIQDKAKLLEEYIIWYPLLSDNIAVHTDMDSGTYCEADLGAIKASPIARSIIAQLYRSQVIYHSFRAGQAEIIRDVITYMESNGLVVVEEE